MRVLHLTGDLLLASQAASLAGRNQIDYLQKATWPEPADASGTELVLVDLASVSGPIEDTIARIRADAPQAHIVAYGPHVHAERLRAAAAAGCDEVLSRGQFTRELARLFQGETPS